MHIARSWSAGISLALICTLAWVAALALVPAGASAEETKQVLLIGHQPDHPYRSHCYLPDSELLAKCLRQTPGVAATVSRGWPEDKKLLADADCIVLHVAVGGDFFFHPSHRDEAAALLKRGIGLAAIHWSTGASNNDTGRLWLETMGGHFHTDFSGLNTTESRVRPAAPDHPVCRGWSEYPLREEYYIKLRFLPDAKPTILVPVDGTDYPLSWVYERPDGGRSFGFVGGHFHDNFAIDEFRRSIVNGILWATKVEVPAEGAPCKIAPEDLVLSEEFEAVKNK